MATNLGNHVYALRRTAIASCYVAPETKVCVFFQDYDGGIRKVKYDQAMGYVGGDKGSVISAASDVKYHTALAVVSSIDPCKEITLFYISRDNHLRGVVYNKSCWEPMNSLNCMDIAVCPASGLATLRYNDGKNLRLYYQQPDLIVRELQQANDGPCTLSDFSISALVGSSLACANWVADDKSLQEIQFFWQDKSCGMRSTFYIPSVGHWDAGYLHLPNMLPGCVLAVLAHRYLGYNADVVRTYTIEPDGHVKERSWRSDTEEWSETQLVKTMVESKLCCHWFPLRDNPEVRLFYQGLDGSLMGYSLQGRRWVNEHKVPCGD